jgi:hypothetical protein
MNVKLHERQHVWKVDSGKKLKSYVIYKKVRLKSSGWKKKSEGVRGRWGDEELWVMRHIKKILSKDRIFSSNCLDYLQE